MFLFSNSTHKHKNCPFNHFEQHNSRQSYIEDFKISKNIKGGPLCPFHNHLSRKRMSFSHLICSVVLKQGLITLLQVLCQRNQWFMLSRLEEFCLKGDIRLKKKGGLYVLKAEQRLQVLHVRSFDWSKVVCSLAVFAYGLVYIEHLN